MRSVSERGIGHLENATTPWISAICYVALRFRSSP